MDNNNFTSLEKQKETPVQKEVLNTNSLNTARTPDTVNVAVSKPPGFEEFTYKSSSKPNVKKILKVFVFIITSAVIILPLVFLFLKYYPFSKTDTKKRGEIIWWNLGGNETVLNKMVDEYRQKNPEVKITLQVQSEVDYGERLINSLKEGKGPDVFTIHNSWVPMMIQHLDSVPTSVYKGEDYVKDFYPVVAKDFRTSVGIVAIPLEYDAITLYINDDIFARSGQVYPKTWDQLISLAASLTTRGEKNVILQSGASLGLTENVDYWQDIVALLILQNKSNLFSPEAEETGTYSIGAMRTFADFYVVTKSWNNTLPASTIAFAEGKTAMYLAPGRAIFEIQKLNPNLKFRTVIVPQVRKDDPSEPDITYATYWAHSVWKNSNSKDLAWDFLKYLSSDESYEKMAGYAKEFGTIVLASPKLTMREKLTNDRYLGSIVALAPVATSWYLVDKTNDGPKGINTAVNTAYKKTVDKLASTRRGKDQTVLLKSLSLELKKALLVFGIIR